MNELEKQFFNTYGIEPFTYCSKPILDCDARKNGTCTKDCEYYSGVLYPQITDRILLELICILSQHYSLEEENWFLSCDSIDYLKQFILSHLIELKENTWFCSKHQVQALFKEVE
jgi:hypothetical protein